jgi:hypothetical protein
VERLVRPERGGRSAGDIRIQRMVWTKRPLRMVWMERARIVGLERMVRSERSGWSSWRVRIQRHLRLVWMEWMEFRFGLQRLEWTKWNLWILRREWT